MSHVWTVGAGEDRPWEVQDMVPALIFPTMLKLNSDETVL
jgi:hypothetical protein